MTWPGTERGRHCPSRSRLAIAPVGTKKAGALSPPPAVPVSVLVTSSVGQRTPGAAGKQIISVSVIDIEIIDLIVPVGAPSANAFMMTTIALPLGERNFFHNRILVGPREGFVGEAPCGVELREATRGLPYDFVVCQPASARYPQSNAVDRAQARLAAAISRRRWSTARSDDSGFPAESSSSTERIASNR